MTTKIGGIVVDIDARLTKMEAALAKADRDFSRFEKNIKSQGNSIQKSLAGIDSGFATMGKSIAGFVAGIGVMGFVELGRQVLSFADDLSAAADQAGMGVERYQTLTEALRTLEVDGAKADKAFETLQATLGDVQSGAENGATKAIESLGITADIMNGKITTSDQLLDALAEASKNAGSEAQFTADMVDIFGKKVGVDMANALKDGGVALNQLEQDFTNTGKVIDEQMIAKLADANEAVDRFTSQTRNQFVIWAADAISSLESVAAWVDRVQHRLAQMSPLGDPSKFGHINAAWERENIDRLVQEQRWKVVESRSTVNQRLGSRMSDAAVKQASNDLERQSAELERLTGILKSVQPPATAGGAGPAFTPRPDSGGGGRSSRSRAAKTPKHELTAAELRANAALKDEDYLSLDAMKEDVPGLLQSLGMLDGMVVDLGQSVQEIPDIGKMLPPGQEERMLQFASAFREDLTGGLADAIVYGEDLGDILEDTFKRAAAALLQSGLLSILTNGQQGFNIGAALTSAFGGGFASGGRPPVGKYSLVGEHGPELMKFDRPGTIIPNHRLHEVNAALGSGEGGGAPVVVYQTFKFDGIATTKEELVQGLLAVKADTLKTFRNMRGRGAM